MRFPKFFQTKSSIKDADLSNLKVYVVALEASIPAGALVEKLTAKSKESGIEVDANAKILEETIIEMVNGKIATITVAFPNQMLADRFIQEVNTALPPGNWWTYKSYEIPFLLIA